MDVLSDVLRSVRLTGAIYFDVHAGAPWVAETPPVSSICDRVMPEFEHVIAFHIMLQGWCWAQISDLSEPAIRLESGDAVIFAAGDPHFMGTERGRRSSPDMDLYFRPNDRPLPFTLKQLGGSGEKARFVCGYLGCDAHPFNPILNALRRQMHVQGSSVGGTLTRDLISVAFARERTSARRRRDVLVETQRADVRAGDPAAHREPAAGFAWDSVGARRQTCERGAGADAWPAVGELGAGDAGA